MPDKKATPNQQPVAAKERSVTDDGSAIWVQEVAGRALGVPSPAPKCRHFREMTDEEAVIFRRDVERTSAESWKNALRMLELLRGMHHGLAIDQYDHALQCATRAYRANASDEMVLVSLLHDVGKACSIFFHEEISAAMLKPFISTNAYELLKAHTDFQGRFHYHFSGRDPETYLRYRGQPWFDLAMTFSADWDAAALDPGYASKPLSDFTALVQQFLSRSRPLSMGPPAASPVSVAGAAPTAIRPPAAARGCRGARTRPEYP